MSELALPAAAASARRVQGGGWVRGALWDGTWLLNVVWLAPVVFLLARGRDDLPSGALDGLYFALTALFWIGHRVGSTWLAYCTTAYRPLLRAEPVRFLVLPAAVALLLFALLLPPDDALPFGRADRVMGLVILDYLLVTYHFAAQHFGVLSLYRARAGGAARPGARRLDRAFALVLGGLVVVVAEALRGDVFYQGVWMDPWLDPAWLEVHAEAIRRGATYFVVAATLGMGLLDVRARRASPARLLYVAGLGLMAIVALLAERPFLFLFLWTVQHWVAATGLASLVAAGEPAPRGGRFARLLHAVNRRPWLLVLLLAAASVLLLPVMEVEAVGDGGIFYGDRIFGALAAALRESTWVPALVALGFATAFCHYLLDRAVYRLSDPAVRRAARGLVDRGISSSSGR